MFFDKNCALDYKTQYRRLILRYHPDKGGDAAAFRTIQEEYKSILFFINESSSTSWADLMEEEDIESQIKILTDETLNDKRNGQRW